MSDPIDVHQLLRLKRHEQPPPEYFEKFLREFHERQRAELLRQPAWRIAINRVQAFFSDLVLPSPAYAGASLATLLVAGYVSFQILNTDRVPSGGPVVAFVHVTPSVAVAENTPALALDSAVRTAGLNGIQLPTSNPPSALTPSMNRPHYIIDTRPVSYEAPSSF